MTKEWQSANKKKKKRKERKKKMNRHAPHVHEWKKGAAGTDGKAPLVFASKRGSYVPAEKRKMVSGNEKKKRKTHMRC